MAGHEDWCKQPGTELENDAQRDRDALNRLKEIAAQADPAKVARMAAHADAQAAALGFW